MSCIDMNCAVPVPLHAKNRAGWPGPGCLIYLVLTGAEKQSKKFPFSPVIYNATSSSSTEMYTISTTNITIYLYDSSQKN